MSSPGSSSPGSGLVSCYPSGLAEQLQTARMVLAAECHDVIAAVGDEARSGHGRIERCRLAGRQGSGDRGEHSPPCPIHSGCGRWWSWMASRSGCRRGTGRVMSSWTGTRGGSGWGESPPGPRRQSMRGTKGWARCRGEPGRRSERPSDGVRRPSPTA